MPIRKLYHICINMPYLNAKRKIDFLQFLGSKNGDEAPLWNWWGWHWTTTNKPVVISTSHVIGIVSLGALTGHGQAVKKHIKFMMERYSCVCQKKSFDTKTMVYAQASQMTMRLVSFFHVNSLCEWFIITFCYFICFFGKGGGETSSKITGYQWVFTK